VKRIHPFVYGHVVAALIVGVVAGAMVDAQAAGMAAALMTAGAIVSSTVCWWKPGFEAPAWRLIPAAILANPLMLLALGYLAVDHECLTGGRRGLNCLGMAMAILVAGACLLPPFGGWLWRAWKRRSAQAT
jgi:hypothetical protein